MASSKKNQPNIYGRKPSAIVTLDGRTIHKYDSRRQARKHREAEADTYGLETYQTRIVVLEQLPDTKRSKTDGTQQQQGRQKSKNRSKHKRQQGKASVQGNDRRPRRGTSSAVSG